MSKEVIVFLLISMLLQPAASAAGGREETDGGIEKEVFIAAGVQERTLRIGLADCVAYTLKNNSEIKIKRIEPSLREEDVKIKKADFEPAFDADYTLHDNTKPSSTALAGARVPKTRDIDFNAGASGKLAAGTQYDAEFINERYSSNSSFQSVNPYYSSQPKITITQPLFKGFGVLVNKADIMIAQNDKDASVEGFKDKVMETITKTKAAYYDYVFRLDGYSIAELSLKRAKDLLEINKARYAKGLVSSVDLLETEARVAEREKALIQAESDLKSAEDELKLVTNLVDEPELWNAKIELIDRPAFDPQKAGLLESLRNGFEFRPDYEAAKLDLDNRNIKIKTARNSLLPTLDLVGSLGLNGLGKDYQEALQKISGRYKDWSMGLKLTMPWGGAERAEYEQKRLEKAQALIAFKRLEQNIILEIRDKVRGTDVQKRQVLASKLSLEKEKENYAAQIERYAAGQASTHDMLDYQDKLAAAELEYAKAVIDYNVAVIELEKAEGLTLAENGIELEESL